MYASCNQPHQRDITNLLAAVVQACHDMVLYNCDLFSIHFIFIGIVFSFRIRFFVSFCVIFCSPMIFCLSSLIQGVIWIQVPPDAVEPLFKQIVNQFVHDRSRPEVFFSI